MSNTIDRSTRPVEFETVVISNYELLVQIWCKNFRQCELEDPKKEVDMDKCCPESLTVEIIDTTLTITELSIKSQSLHEGWGSVGLGFVFGKKVHDSINGVIRCFNDALPLGLTNKRYDFFNLQSPVRVIYMHRRHPAMSMSVKYLSLVCFPTLVIEP